MKTAVIHRNKCTTRPNLRYPNAASKRELFDRFVDLLLMFALGIAAAAIVLFLLVIT